MSEISAVGSDNAAGEAADNAAAAGDGQYERQLARVRGELPRASVGARDLAQMARNPGCDRMLVHGAARLDMATVARTVFGADVRAHGSPIALGTGIAFERVLLKDGARPLFDLFAGAGWLPPDALSFVNISAVYPRTDPESLSQRDALTLDLLERKLCGDESAPAVIWHPRLTLRASGIEGGVVHVEPDCLVAAPTDMFYTPVEVKSFRDRGPRTSASDLANARLQAAVEVLALRGTMRLAAETIDRRLSEREIVALVPDRCGLVIRRRLGMGPRLRMLNIRREMAIMQRFLAGLRSRVERALAACGATVTLASSDGQEHIANALREDCRDFCHFATNCEAAARRQGLPIVLGSEMEEAVSTVRTLPWLLALLDGREVARSEEECRIVRAFRDATLRTDREVRRVG